MIENKIGKTVNFLSVPGGFYSKRVKQSAQTVGYLGVCTSYVGFNKIDKDFYCLKRINIGGDITLSKFAFLLKGKGVLKKKIIQSLLYISKKVLGIKNYSLIKKLLFKIKLWK